MESSSGGYASSVNPVTAKWGANERQAVGTVDELDALLDRIHDEARGRERPQDVQLESTEGAGTLGILLGHERSVLNHIPDDAMPPYRVSLGEQDADRPFTLYVAGDHHSEAAWRNTVPVSVALGAARTFLLTGELDADLDWQET